MTRAAFVAIAIALVVWLGLQRTIGRRLLVLMIVVGILMVSWRYIEFLFIKDIKLGGSTLDDRLNIWLASISYVWRSNAIWYGIATRGFNETILQIMGRDVASHNITIQYITEYGIIVATIWIIFWLKIIKSGLLALRYSSSMKDRDYYLLLASVLSLVMYFVIAHSANVSGLFYMNGVLVSIYLLWKTRSRILRKL